jgi:acetyl-CoA C-acetyltransferase
MCAMRHMYEYGTTSEQLAWIKVAASHHAQHNPHAMLKEVVTVEDVVNSPMISDPLHRLDCCVITDGGGAMIVARRRSRSRSSARWSSCSAAPRPPRTRAAARSRPDLFRRRFNPARRPSRRRVKPSDIKYASIYDSFTITVLMQLEDLGFCRQGQGRRLRRRRQPDQRASASCRSTPMAAACAATTRPTAAA